jgi:uncharacterized protein YjbI with pentapeptide repeats
MNTITIEELNNLLQLHQELWDDLPTGKRLELDNYDLSNVDFTGKELRSCRLVGCNLQGCNFENCDISHSEFMRSDLRNVNFTNTITIGVDFTDCIQ